MKGTCCGKLFDKIILREARPGGGMAYAGDLKSPVLHRTCGFDPHPGHHSFSSVLLVTRLIRVYACANLIFRDELGVGCGIDVAAADDAADGALLEAFGLAEHGCDAERTGGLRFQIGAGE